MLKRGILVTGFFTEAFVVCDEGCGVRERLTHRPTFDAYLEMDGGVLMD